MKPLRRIAAFLLLVCAVVLLAASVGVVMPRSFRVVGPDGKPAAAWAAHRYRGYQFDFVISSSWSRAGGIIEAEADGMIRMPLLVYLKSPLNGWLEHEIELLYAPGLHATLNVVRPERGAAVALPDNSNEPEAWNHAIDEVYSFIAYRTDFGRSIDDEADRDAVGWIARQLAADYQALLEAHGERRREMPVELPSHFQFSSKEDQAEWLEQMRLEIEREPTWGLYLERRYAKRIAELEEQFGK